MYVGLTRLFENGALNAKFDVEEKLRPGSIDLNWDEKSEIERAIAADEGDKDEEDLRKKNR